MRARVIYLVHFHYFVQKISADKKILTNARVYWLLFTSKRNIIIDRGEAQKERS